MKRILAVGAILAALAAPAGAQAATSGAYLPISGGKTAIRGELSFYQIGSNYGMQVKWCFKPTSDRVKCVFRTREWIDEAGGYWLQCLGLATAIDRWDWIQVRLSSGWIDDCFPSSSRAFI